MAEQKPGKKIGCGLLGCAIPLATFIILLLILLYTFEGGVKTIIYTDTLQTTFILLGLVVCILYIMQHLDLNLSSAMHQLAEKKYTGVLNTDINSK